MLIKIYLLLSSENKLGKPFLSNEIASTGFCFAFSSSNSRKISEKTFNTFSLLEYRSSNFLMLLKPKAEVRYVFNAKFNFWKVSSLSLLIM